MKFKLVWILVFVTSISFAQNSVVDEYINIGLKNNLTLKSKEFSFQQSIADLKKARGMFLPSIDITSRYTRAGGGRQIDIPIGDLVNPMQNALNSLNPQFGFPTNIPNENIPFLQEEEQDTKISLVQPIIQPALFYNYSINKNMVNIQSLEKAIYTREVVFEIKVGYLNILKTKEVVKLYDSSIELLTENLRVNKSLFKNDKITVDHLHRAKSELLEIEQKKLEALNNYDLAKSYFNYLLNNPLDGEILEEPMLANGKSILALEKLESIAIKNREELYQIKSLIDISEDQTGVANSSYFPNLSLAVDYGYQGEKYSFTSDDDYWMASLVFNWNIFNGYQDNAEAEKAEIESKKNKLQLMEVENKIRLQIREAYKKYLLSEKIIKTSEQQLISSEKSYYLIEKKYKAGLASQIEYLDAQNQLTQSAISKILAEYNLLEQEVVLEKITAKLNVESFNN